MSAVEDPDVAPKVEQLWSDADMRYRYGCSREAWRKRRLRGEAPPYFVVGQRLYYDPVDVLAWESRLKGLRI